jgi:hypothetical protein
LNNYLRKLSAFRYLELFLKKTIISNLLSLKRFLRPMHALPAAQKTQQLCYDCVQRILIAMLFNAIKF